MFELFSPQKKEAFTLAEGPNRWDWALLPLVLALIVLFAYAAMQMSRPFVVGEVLAVSLDPSNLPYYLLRTILRMFTALFFSLLFSFIFASVAVKFKTAEKFLELLRSSWCRYWTYCSPCLSCRFKRL